MPNRTLTKKKHTINFKNKHKKTKKLIRNKKLIQGKKIKRKKTTRKKIKRKKTMRNKTKGGFLNLSGYYTPLMYTGSVMSAYIFMIAMLANNPEVTKKIKNKMVKTGVLAQGASFVPNNLLKTNKDKFNEHINERLKHENCSDYRDIIKNVIENLSPVDKKKFIDQYLEILSKGVGGGVNDDIGEWNKKMDRFFFMVCSDSKNKSGDLEKVFDYLVGDLKLGNNFKKFEETHRIIIRAIKKKFDEKAEAAKAEAEEAARKKAEEEEEAARQKKAEEEAAAAAAAAAAKENAAKENEVKAAKEIVANAAKAANMMCGKHCIDTMSHPVKRNFLLQLKKKYDDNKKELNKENITINDALIAKILQEDENNNNNIFNNQTDILYNENKKVKDKKVKDKKVMEGWTIIQNTTDGNCLFNVISQALKYISNPQEFKIMNMKGENSAESDHTKVRNDICDYMKNLYFQIYDLGDYDNKNEYI